MTEWTECDIVLASELGQSRNSKDPDRNLLGECATSESMWYEYSQSNYDYLLYRERI